MEEKIKNYLVNETKMNEFFAAQFVESVKKYDDIFAEFVEFVDTKEYKDGVKSGEWTAKALHEKLPHLAPQNIFEFLVGLRDNPESYQKYIAEGAQII